MIYIEYMEHDRCIPLEVFQTRRGEPWHPETKHDSIDHPVAVLGRTLSLGPHPPYMAIWRCKALEKLEEWEAYFTARQRLHETASRSAIHLSNAGCYNEAFTGPPIGEGIQYIEYFAYGLNQEEKDITPCFTDRMKLLHNGSLNFVLCRMGPLGPDPGGLAIWTFPSHGEIEEIILAGKGRKDVGIVTAGIYRRLGEETA